MPQTSVPNDALMKTQQAKDSPAPKRAKTKAKAGQASRPKTALPAGNKAPAKPALKSASKANVASQTGKAKTKTVKAAPAPAATGQGTVKPKPAAKAATSTAAPAKPKEGARSGWSLGRLFSFFSRSKGEKALEKASDSSLGKGK